MKKKEIDLNTFKKKYLEENLTLPECARYFECGKTTVVRFCKKHNISKDKDLIYKNISKSSTIHNHELVCDLYFKENYTKQQIADKLKIKIGAVSKIITLSNRSKTKKQIKDNSLKIDVSREDLVSLYIDQNKSLNELCQKFNVGHTALRGALRRYGIYKSEELRQKLVRKSFIESGKMNCIDGLSTRQIKEKIGLSETYINKVLKEREFNSSSDLFDFLNDIKDKNMTSLEKIIEEKLNLCFFNKKIQNSTLKYKPDFKVNKHTYLNADGLYWHSESIQTNNRYHFEMRQNFESEGIRIIQFRADEIRYKTDIVLSMINNLTNTDITTVYGRKCQIDTVSQQEANDFLQANHLMGKTNAKHVGLRYDGELVFIVSYKNYQKGLKIERLCSKLNTRVLGGYGKLEKYIVNLTKPSRIDYWVDLRYGTGNFLKDRGYILERETLGWKWTDFNLTYNRRKIRANMDERRLSEREYSDELGVFKIYDAGQRLWSKLL